MNIVKALVRRLQKKQSKTQTVKQTANENQSIVTEKAIEVNPKPYIMCTTCRGLGVVDHYVCYGRGYYFINCDSCQGSGWDEFNNPCCDCDGSGGENEYCWECNGSGRWRCPTCNGRGCL